MEVVCGWVRFLYYISLLFWESFEMYKIEWDILKRKMYKNQTDGVYFNDMPIFISYILKIVY